MLVSALRGIYSATDISQTVASRSAAASVLAGIILALPFPAAARLQWTAVVSSLEAPPALVQFRRTFVTSDPWPITFAMTGHDAGAP